MKSLIHKIAVIGIIVVATMDVIGIMRSPNGTSITRALQTITGAAIWSVLTWLIYKHPRKCGLGVGIFLFLMIASQFYFWQLAVVYSGRDALFAGYDAFSFVLYEIPILVAGICCIQLRFQFPTEAKNISTSCS